MRQPRRIFRRSPGRTGAGLRPILATIGVGGALLLGSVGLLAWGGRAPPPHRAPSVPADIAADPAQVAVVDGDTLRLRDTVIRLRGVDAPERGGCGAALGDGAGPVDCGNGASATLAALVRARRVECQLSGSDDAGRPLGLCRAGGLEINEAVVESGWALAGSGDPGLASAQALARAQRRGLWSSRP